ncbi:hypothetical protein OIT44_04040 [Weissella ceti]|uniref:Phage protein n=1 Tax=Weissella ceti TaxID=759620 RepID=A0ABT3E4F7_9LACO|nr:hypothetical protein [Weissella ceti]MCW0953245.1 hypothetical protein [Weissella ceti]QVK12761.1 hypothetical protein KHQ31_03800 [Weissella ceti]
MMLEIKIRNQETGKDEVVSQDFIPLKSVFSWLEFEEKLTVAFAKQAEFEDYVNRANNGENMDDVAVPETVDMPTGTSVLRGRLELIADLFDDKRVTVDALMENGNAMDKLVPLVQTYVMDQYSANDTGKVSKP